MGHHYKQNASGPEDDSNSQLRLFIRNNRRAIKIALLLAILIIVAVIATLIIMVFFVLLPKDGDLVSQSVSSGSWQNWAISVKDWLSQFLGQVTMDKIIQWVNLYNLFGQ